MTTQARSRLSTILAGIARLLFDRTPRAGLYLYMPNEPTAFGPFTSNKEAREFFDATTYEWWSRHWTPEQVDAAWQTAGARRTERDERAAIVESRPAEMDD